MEMKGLWIPIEIVKNPSLTAVEKFIISDVLAMVSGGLPYFKSNATLALDFDVSPGTISRSIGSLIEAGHLRLVKFDGRKREVTVDAAYLNSARQHTQKRVGRVTENKHSATSKAQHSNTTSKAVSKQLNKWWNTDSLSKAWNDWVDEQKANRKKTYSKRAKTMAMNRLKELSNSNEEQAVKLINYAILRRWDTFWPLPQNHTKNEKGFNPENFSKDGLNDFIANG